MVCNLNATAKYRKAIERWLKEPETAIPSDRVKRSRENTNNIKTLHKHQSI